jgi:hypothetical protein
VEQDLVEALELDLQVRADLLLAVVREVEAEEELAVAVETELAEEPLHLPRLLLGQDPLQRSRVTAGERGSRMQPFLLAFVEGTVARLLAPIGNEQVARRAADEPAELFGLPHLATADLREDKSERLLMEIVGQGQVLDEAAEHEQEAAAEADHELALGGRVARLDPADEGGHVSLRRLGRIALRSVPPHPGREDDRRQDEDETEPVG